MHDLCKMHQAINKQQLSKRWSKSLVLCCTWFCAKQSLAYSATIVHNLNQEYSNPLLSSQYSNYHNNISISLVFYYFQFQYSSMLILSLVQVQNPRQLLISSRLIILQARTIYPLPCSKYFQQLKAHLQSNIRMIINCIDYTN